MDIHRHCTERLPHGERQWRRAARMSKFDGKLVIVGLGHYEWNRRELKSRRRKDQGVTRGSYSSNEITVFINNAPCAVRDPKAPCPFETFCHELGHHRQYLRGERLGVGVSASLKEWRANHAEQAADRYGRMLRKKVLG